MSDLLDELRGHSLAEIRASLAETIEWCSNPVHDREANRPLRSVALEPQALYGSRKRVVGHVISCRKDQLIHQRHEAWLGFLRRDRSLVWALVRGRIRLWGSPTLLRRFARCFPS